jgi:hypothetical protein
MRSSEHGDEGRSIDPMTGCRVDRAEAGGLIIERMRGKSASYGDVWM